MRGLPSAGRRVCVGGLLAVSLAAVSLVPLASSAPVAAETVAASAAGSGYVALVAPCRVVDTRLQSEGWIVPSAPTPGSREFRVAGSGALFAAQGGSGDGCGVPDGVDAVELSITAVSPVGAGFVRVTPNDGTLPDATLLNFNGAGITNTGTVMLSDVPERDLKVWVYGTATHIAIDVQGYFSDRGGLGYVPLAAPCRAADTRNTFMGRLSGAGPWGDSRPRWFWVGGSTIPDQGGQKACGVPWDATAVEVSVTVIDPQGAGFMRVVSWQEPEASAAFLNYQSGVGVTNTGIVPLGAGNLTVRNFGGSVHLAVDVHGFFSETASTSAALVGEGSGPAPVSDPLGQRAFRVGGSSITDQGARASCGVPDSATAVEASVTVVDPQGAGFMRVAPHDGSNPNAAFINYRSGVGVTNTGTVSLASGRLLVRNFGGSAHLVIDVQGYFQSSSASNPLGFTPLRPCRVVDTRNTPSGRISSPTPPPYVNPRCPLGAPVSNSFTFLLLDRGCPVRWDPCRTIPWWFNPAGAVRSVSEVQAAFVQVAAGSGLRFEYRGHTTISSEAWMGVRSGYGIVLDFVELPGELAGFAGMSSQDGMAQRGWVQLDRTFQTGSSGDQARRGWADLMLHEIGHAVGLSHVELRSERMYPTLLFPFQDRFGTGDLQGLRHLGRDQGCAPAVAIAADAPLLHSRVAN